MDRKIHLPEELMPDEDFNEMAKQQDEEYRRLYRVVRDNIECDDEYSATAAIAVLAEFTTMRVAMLIGEDLSDYDISLLRGVIERHIAQVVFVE